MKISFYGSSLLSAYWNGAATYYRGILQTLHRRGHEITFFEPDILDRQKYRDLDSVPYARTVIYPANSEKEVREAVKNGSEANIIIKASGVGAFDSLLEKAVLELQNPNRAVVFWDVDAPATLERLHSDPDDPFLQCVPEFDLILTYGGGDPVVQAYSKLGANGCVPVYNAFDPETHHPVKPDSRFSALFGFVGNRLPDREMRVREFFHKSAELLPDETFLLAGSGWESNGFLPKNVRHLGHLYTRDHNAFNCTPRAVLNVLRDGMAETGFSPATRVFEAAGAGACLITDSWKGIELFLEPGIECLVAENGEEVAGFLQNLTAEEAKEIGEAARNRVLQEHTYEHRAAQVENLLSNLKSISAAKPVSS